MYYNYDMTQLVLKKDACFLPSQYLKVPVNYTGGLAESTT